MSKKFLGLVFLISLFLTSAPLASAACPVCVVAVGAGLGLSRWLGIDDLISGVWIGGLVFLLGFGLHLFLKNKNQKSYFPFQKIVLPILFLILNSLIFYLITF